MSQTQLTFTNGRSIPVIGFGTWQIEAGEAIEEAVYEALKVGYRLIDTAAIYGNEEGVGVALRRAIDEKIVTREEVTITSKVWNDAHGYEETLAAFEESRQRLGLEYIDLYLIHWPVTPQGLYTESWRALETLLEEGRVHTIGVSNFDRPELEVIMEKAHIMPMVNQIEVHHTFQQPELVAYCQSLGMAVQAYRPLAGGRNLDHPLLLSLAEKHDRTPAQIVLRYHLERKLAIIPKSIDPLRMKDNRALYNFSLDEEDRLALAKLDDPEHGRLCFPPYPV